MSANKNSGGGAVALGFALHAIPEDTEEEGYPQAFGEFGGDSGQGGTLRSKQHNLNLVPGNVCVPGTDFTVTQVREAVGMMSRQEGPAAGTGFGNMGNRVTDEIPLGRITPACGKTCDSEGGPYADGDTNSKFAESGLKLVNPGVLVNSDLLASQILSSIINHVIGSNGRDGNY